jgi:ribosomal-protein-alanine N-acetyltransferase
MIGEALYVEAADARDAEALASLERRSFSHPWTVRHFQSALDDRERNLVLVLRTPFAGPDPERGIRGYCVLESVVDELHLHDVAIHPEHRGRGLGRFLLGLALEIGARRGAETAFLEVRRSNWPALGLYRTLGFETVSVRRDYYAHPREDAIVLRKAGLEISRGAC